ncbi:MAG: SAM-dependent chlorinase/fluorinase [Verrucomicrobia bacterium]|nr:SAM-dependent chlorinase/fluorinase [Verrucomicrobiota bacterium]
MRIITLTTDFGLSDWFVGAMRGVILGLAPRAQIVDLTHGVPPGDVRAGAFALAAGCRCFPRGTIHVAVVDPGVGSARHALAVRTDDYVFVGPDNGLLSFALAGEKVRAVRRLTEERWFRRPVSRNFHGRDVFAPVAAHLSRGLPFAKLGPSAADWVRLPWPEPVTRGRTVRGEVVYLDRFGNAITSIRNEQLPPREGLVIRLSGNRRIPLRQFYQAVPAGRPVALPGSAGLLEVAVNGGSAADRLGLRIGSVLEMAR